MPKLLGVTTRCLAGHLSSTMSKNKRAPEVRYNLKNYEEGDKPPGAVGVSTSYHGTVKGAAVMTVAPLAVFMAASHPLVAAAVLAIVVGIVTAGRNAMNRPPPDGLGKQAESGSSASHPSTPGD